MLLQDYRMEIFNNKCMPGAMSVQCLAHLNQDVSRALPYLNSELGGFEYVKEPAAVTFRTQGKLITIQGRKIAVNALKDEGEARKIVEWLRREINDVWKRRAQIEPRFEGAPRPRLIEILKQLPKTNCRECGEATCMVFAARMAEGAKGVDACPALGRAQRRKLTDYMSRFNLSD